MACSLPFELVIFYELQNRTQSQSISKTFMALNTAEPLLAKHPVLTVSNSTH
jgi:hypothetical protein